MGRSRRRRVLIYGSNAVVAVVVVAAILVVANLLAARYRTRFDMTPQSLFSLSDQTETLLDSLKKDVHVVAFFREKDRPAYEELLKNYAYHSRLFSYR